MAGFAEGAEARAAFISNLHYACDAAVEHGITILIEPLNRYDAPGYFLKTSTQAKSIIEAAGRANLKLMFHLLGYDAPLGAEYTPVATTDAGLGWLWAARRDESATGSSDRRKKR